MAESVCKTVIAHKALSHWIFLLYTYWHLQHLSKKAAEVNTVKLVVMKRTHVNQEKNIENQKIQRTENGGKGRENGGKERILKIEV